MDPNTFNMMWNVNNELVSLFLTQEYPSQSGSIILPSTVRAGDLVVLVVNASNSNFPYPTESIPVDCSKVTFLTSMISASINAKGVYVKLLTTSGTQTITGLFTGSITKRALIYVYRSFGNKTITAFNIVQPNGSISTGNPPGITGTGATVVAPALIILGTASSPSDVTPSPLLPSSVILSNESLVGLSYYRQYYKSYYSGEVENWSIDIGDSGDQSVLYGCYIQLTMI